jgi:LmbE family N-acetylglucosaminyl deacetylase
MGVLTKRAIIGVVKRVLGRDPGRSNYKFVVKDWVDLVDLKACSRVLETKRFSQNLRPIELERPDKKRIMIIAPHPDDDTFGAGGTIMEAVSRGAKVTTIYITDGHDDPDRVTAIRQEARRVCEATGATPIFLGLQPRKIPLDDPDVNARLVASIREFRPEAIFITFVLDDHDDHRRVNQLLLTADEQVSLKGIEVWAYQVYSTVLPNVVVNITSRVERKRELIRMWRSVSGNRDWAHYVLGMNAANCRYLSTSEPAYAETFFVVPIEEYLELCRLYFSRSPGDIYYSELYRTESSPV